jgi:hypothetical protein
MDSNTTYIVLWGFFLRESFVVDVLCREVRVELTLDNGLNPTPNGCAFHFDGPR